MLRLAVVLGVVLLAATGLGQTAPTGQSYAVLVGGLGGQEPYGRWYADWLTRFQSYLTATVHVPAANVVALSGKDATLEAITAAFRKLGERAKPEDQLILFLVGHGEISGSSPRLTLAGPDPTPTQIAALLEAFPAKKQVILNFSASSGDFLKGLSAANRVNLAATSPTEIEEPVFAEFFLRGLDANRADADKDGTVTLLEAYNWAARQTALWIVRWEETDPGKPIGADQTPGPSVWKASGKETVEVFEKLYAGVADRQLDPASDRNAADVDMALTLPGGQVTPEWLNRRVVDEHALLEDGGQGIGVSVITDAGFQPVLGAKEGDPGYLAAHTVLGRP